MVKDTMYYVGDNEVASYLLKADMGTPNDLSDDKVIKVDTALDDTRLRQMFDRCISPR